MDAFWSSVVTIVIAIIGVATLAVLVSPQAKTGEVINAGFKGTAGLLNVALSPVTGGQNTYSGGGASFFN